MACAGVSPCNSTAAMTSLLQRSAVVLSVARRLNTNSSTVVRKFSVLAASVGHRDSSFTRPHIAEFPLQVAVRTFKDMDVLTKRCKDCYFKKGDDRWYVLCKTHGRHKQRQRLPDERHFWIITHKTHGPRKNF
ncbi:large ribosomal subunit protein bL36m [Dermacentor albipictus]|uniref:large ribosomal subunit protein bL36m n=1 Tax=Dermacentor albipictus TaxID=60249 RepID=UPI0031FBF627